MFISIFMSVISAFLMSSLLLSNSNPPSGEMARDLEIYCNRVHAQLQSLGQGGTSFKRLDDGRVVCFIEYIDNTVKGIRGDNSSFIAPQNRTVDYCVQQMEKYDIHDCGQ